MNFGRVNVASGFTATNRLKELERSSKCNRKGSEREKQRVEEENNRESSQIY